MNCSYLALFHTGYVIIGDYEELNTEERENGLRGGWCITVDRFLSNRVMVIILKY